MCWAESILNAASEASPRQLWCQVAHLWCRQAGKNRACVRVLGKGSRNSGLSASWLWHIWLRHDEDSSYRLTEGVVVLLGCWLIRTARCSKQLATAWKTPSTRMIQNVTCILISMSEEDTSDHQGTDRFCIILQILILNQGWSQDELTRIVGSFGLGRFVKPTLLISTHLYSLSLLLYCPLSSHCFGCANAQSLWWSGLVNLRRS